jgi:1-aminocyclopropane-1-carboxylate deaminase/D-cysteine desulfhydrase-like pyridoxal-dependent ACC family enzyme
MVTLRHIGMRKVVVREAVREGRLVSEWCQRVSAIGQSGVPNVECRRNHRGKGLVEIPPRSAEIEVDDSFLGEGYGIPTPEGMAAIRLLARLEGLLLDPVYTGKAMAGLIAMIREGRFSDEQNVVFLHTGGWPALFAYEEELAEEEAPR